MATYFVTRSNYTPTVGNDVVTITASGTRPVRVRKIGVGGLGTASAANALRATRSTGGTTGGGALTPGKQMTDTPAFGGTAYTTWSAQPTLVSDDGGVRLPYNANGGVNWWHGEILLRPSEQLSVRQEVGTSVSTIHVEIEEL